MCFDIKVTQMKLALKYSSPLRMVYTCIYTHRLAKHMQIVLKLQAWDILPQDSIR